MSEKFEVIYADKVNDENGEETTLVTSTELSEHCEDVAMQRIAAAFENKYEVYQPYTKEHGSATLLDFEKIKSLAGNIQNDLDKVLQLNAIIRRFIVTDDIIGKVYESLETNLNTNFKLSYTKFDGRNKNKQMKRVDQIIDEFNYEVNLKQIIRDAIPLTYAEGNHILYLRKEGETYSIDFLPLGIAKVSDYTVGGNPQIIIDVTELTSRLRKVYEKDKKQKAIFFKNIEEDIRNNYPPEVYTAYKAGERIAKLDPKRARIMRICNMGRKYGVSPIVRALRSALMLENIEDSDYINNKAKAKKIIHQILRKETMGTNLEKQGLSQAAYAHSELMKAWKNKTVVYTSAPFVEKIQYVEPSVNDTSADKINLYRSKIMTTLGIGFIDSNVSSFSVANISLEQLMKTINSISEQLERIIMDFYKIVLDDYGIGMEYLPTIQIIDAEQLSLSMKKDLVELMYSKLNCSLESALEVLGVSIEDEKQKRLKENSEGIEEIFFPRKTSYTTGSDDNETGRPADSDNLEKQAYDNNREENE